MACPQLAKDDKVIYFQFAGDRMKSRAGESFVVLRESDIFGKLEN
jgi:co-chaperonin GroES (HSP10)